MKSLFIYEDEIEAIFKDYNSDRIANSLNLNGSDPGIGLIKRALTINGGTIEVIAGKVIKIIGNTDYGDNIFRITFPKVK